MLFYIGYTVGRIRMKKAVCFFVFVLLAGSCVATAQQAANYGKELNIPPPPPKPKPDMQYGNTARAAIVAERLTEAAQGNAVVHIDEGCVITVEVYLKQDASPYDMAGTMANLTYMLADMYSMTDKANCDIALKVYDTSNSLIIDAKFNVAKNAFEYFRAG
jgi:hypothetical protein